MRQYWIYVLNCLCNVVFCAVDGAFGNNISIDAIVVMGSFTIFESFCIQFLHLGRHAYKVLQKYEKSCCLLSLIAGLFFGAICIIGARPLTYIFDLSDVQREMLRQAFICYGLCCPIEAVGRFIQGYATYKCYNKLALLSNFLTYILLIGTDWLVVVFGWGVNGLILSTGFTWLVYALILLVCTNFLKVNDKIKFNCLKTAFSKGKDLMLGGIISRGGNLCFGHFASMMSTEQYAIHSVALGAISLAEEFRDAQCDYTIVRLHGRENHKEQKVKQIFKQCWLPSLILQLIASFLLTIVMHGKVSLPEAFYGVAIYNMQTLILPIYDTVQQFAISRGKTKYSLIACCICMVWRTAIIWLCSFWEINIWVLGIIYILDYASRTVFYILALKHNKKLHLAEKEKLNVTN